jgi:hypothetical protein
LGVSDFWSGVTEEALMYIRGGSGYSTPAGLADRIEAVEYPDYLSSSSPNSKDTNTSNAISA